MQIKEYLEKYQPVIYQTFVNALRSDKLSHAYLLSGSTGMPLKETALYLAKSILCDSPNPLACDTCMTCVRVDENNYADIMIFDGKKESIKKENIESIIDNFDKTALEDKGIMIYILHIVESMQLKATNSLLKFLEEPGKNIYAFLTTENESKILPTILSRSQVLRFKEIDRDLIIEEAIKTGIDEADAQILSAFYSDTESIKEAAKDDKYLQIKDVFEQVMEALCENKDDAIFVSQQKVLPLLKDSKESTRVYIKLLGELFKDVVNKSVGEETTLKCYDEYISKLANKVAYADKLLSMLLSAPSKLDINLNTQLLLDHLIYRITREVK